MLLPSASGRTELRGRGRIQSSGEAPCVHFTLRTSRLCHFLRAAVTITDVYDRALVSVEAECVRHDARSDDSGELI